jgi:pimeloyl-ACP methyl ester carboxylesterase
MSSIKCFSIKRVSFLAVLAILFLSFPLNAFAATCTTNSLNGVTTCTGSLPDGATYLIDVPPKWNGILFLYSHGYVVPGTPNPAQDAAIADPATHSFMLFSGFALAGSSYAHAGWAIQEALLDQIAVLDIFKTMVGTPVRTIAWGHSLGGIITAGLIQRYPDRFDAALPMCGVLSGGVATWNSALDSAFAFHTLLGVGTPLQVVNIANPGPNLALAEGILLAAQSTPQGRARLALVSALSDGPGWFDPLSPEPSPSDFATQEFNQFLWAQNVDFPFAFALRAELEFRARGNPSSNVGVNYRSLLARSIDRNEVVALYQQAGLDLNADLEMLQDAPRISADPEAVHYLESNIIFDGQIGIPVLTMHTKGDGLVLVQNESAYNNVVSEAENSAFLRQTFVHRAGHCAFTSAETIAAVQSLLFRLNTGSWGPLDPDSMNAAASALGPGLNGFIVPAPPPMNFMFVPVAPAYFDFTPSQFLRPFDALGGGCQSDPVCRAQFPVP